MTLTSQTEWIGLPGYSYKHVFNVSLFPSCHRIVDVRRRLASSSENFGKSYLNSSSPAKSSSRSELPKTYPDAKLMKMGILPAHGRLQDFMQIAKHDLAGHDNLRQIDG